MDGYGISSPKIHEYYRQLNLW